jgi:hypothetical protein
VAAFLRQGIMHNQAKQKAKRQISWKEQVSSKELVKKN